LQRFVDYAARFNGCVHRILNIIVAAEIEAKLALPLRQHKREKYSKVFDQCKRRVRDLQTWPADIEFRPDICLHVLLPKRKSELLQGVPVFAPGTRKDT